MKIVSLPSSRELVCCLGLWVCYYVLTSFYVGLQPMHLFLGAAFLLLYCSTELTRKLAVALLPFVVFAVSYDWMRVVPNYQVNPIDVRGLYQAERSIFGIFIDGYKVTLNEYFMAHCSPFADFFAGLFYLCWVPVPVLFGVCLFFSGRRELYLRFALAFLLVNLIGFAGYYLHPAAPPWYVMKYGFEPILGTPGDVAGLARFDELLGVNIFHSIYCHNSNVFAAVPSLHAAYMLIAFVYAVSGKCARWVQGLFAIICLGIWWTAVYSGHHYVIDVCLGILTSLLGILLLERVLLPMPSLKRAFSAYLSYIE